MKWTKRGADRKDSGVQKALSAQKRKAKSQPNIPSWAKLQTKNKGNDQGRRIDMMFLIWSSDKAFGPLNLIKWLWWEAHGKRTRTKVHNNIKR
jgi:hypothetical protein